MSSQRSFWKPCVVGTRGGRPRKELSASHGHQGGYDGCSTLPEARHTGLAVDGAEATLGGQGLAVVPLRPFQSPLGGLLVGTRSLAGCSHQEALLRRPLAAHAAMAVEQLRLQRLGYPWRVVSPGAGRAGPRSHSQGVGADGLAGERGTWSGQAPGAEAHHLGIPHEKTRHSPARLRHQAHFTL